MAAASQYHIDPSEDAEHFHEFGHVANIVHIESEYRHKFIQKPRIHQFIKAGQIHRSKKKRPVGQFELFLDLVMVGVVHQLADLASETEDGMAVARFVLTFWGAWSIWSDYRNYVNVSSMDDFPQRVYTLCMMAIMIGYSANSTGVVIEHNKYVDDESTHASMRGAVGFLLVAKCIRFILHMFYGLYLPEFFYDQTLLAAWMLVACALYIGSMFCPNIQTGTILFGCAGIVENVQLFFGMITYTTMSKVQRQLCTVQRLGWFKSRIKDASVAVINIEHAAERNGGFYTIVLGESVTNLLWQVAKYPHSAGVNQYYGRAFCILLVSFNLNWLYFTEDWTVEKVHPIRRHWTTAIIYQFLHWPLSAGLIISSAAVAQLVHPSTIEQADSKAGRYYWGGGMAVALFCLSIFDLLPKWDFWTWDRIVVQITRLVFRLGSVAICATVPLVDHSILSNSGFLGIYAGVFVFLVGEELIGKVLIMNRTKNYEEKECEAQAGLHQASAHVVDDINEDSNESTNNLATQRKPRPQQDDADNQAYDDNTNFYLNSTDGCADDTSTGEKDVQPQQRGERSDSVSSVSSGETSNQQRRGSGNSHVRQRPPYEA